MDVGSFFRGRGSRLKFYRGILSLVALLLLFSGRQGLRAKAIYVPNGSFESPATVFVDPQIDAWQKSPTPGWYDESAYGPWDQLMGVFLNTPPGDTNSLVNCSGTQAAFLFAMPQVTLTQDLPSPGAGAAVPTFKPGKVYDLTLGVLGNGGGMAEGATLDVSLYYRDASSNMATIATITVTNSNALFPDRNHLVDFTAHLAGVTADAPWAGKPIGVRIASTVDPALAGGYWDVDNVRLLESIAVPNASFESPATVFVDTQIDDWQESPQPFWYDADANGPWEQLAGVFLNTPPDSTNQDHIINLDGLQAAFLFALPGVALFEDNVSTTNALNATFEPGQSYQLTVAVLGNGGGMTPGATLQAALYYRDAADNFVTVGAVTITNSSTLFPNRTNLVDFTALVPPVKPTDPWAGKPIGVQIASTGDFSLAGGYWDVDNVRLVTFHAPMLGAASTTGGGFNFSLRSEPGLPFEIRAAGDPTSVRSQWTRLSVLTNTTGVTSFLDSNANLSRRFYQVRQLP